MHRTLLESLRSNARVLAVGIAVQALLGWVAARAYLAHHHTLQANGRWVATKTTLERGLIGAFSFVTERQALAGGALNLGAWHGYQEVVYHREIDNPVRIELDLTLGPAAYVAVIFNRGPDGAYSALRLSRTDQYPSAFLTVTAAGEFLRREPIGKELPAPGATHRVRVDLGDTEIGVRLDGEPFAAFADRRLARQSFGFRGNAFSGLVDNVEVELASGEVIREDFAASAGAWWLTPVLVGAVIAINLLLFLVVRRLVSGGGRRLGFAFLTANLTLLVIGALLYGLVLVRAGWYPGLGGTLERAEEYFREGERRQVLLEIRDRYPRKVEDDRFRILVVGTSQTWGAGARREDETFVAVLEELLNRRRPGGPRFECINAGFSALKAKHLAPIVDNKLLPLAPRIVIFNLATNDRLEAETFGPSVRRMVQASLAAGARALLVLEANEKTSFDAGQLGRFADLGRVAEELGVPVLDMHSHLAESEDLGFVWWDMVHLTSFGHRLVAEKLLEELHRLGWLPSDPSRG